MGVARPIKIIATEEAPGSLLVFDDGTEEEVRQAADVLAFFKYPGPLQNFALTVFGARHEAVQADIVRDALETPRAKAKREMEERVGQKAKPLHKKPGRKPAGRPYPQYGHQRPQLLAVGVGEDDGNV